MSRGEKGAWIIISAVFLVFSAMRSSAEDLDEDGINDALEHSLLETFRPFFAFAADETFRPTDIRFYIQNSNLLKSGEEDQSPLIGVESLRNSPSDGYYRLH